MRRAAKVDGHHALIVKRLREVGCDVLSLAGVGVGVPDLLVHRAGRLYLCEIKRPAGTRGGRSEDGQKLGEAQIKFAQRWPVHVVMSVADALHVIGVQ